MNKKRIGINPLVALVLSWTGWLTNEPWRRKAFMLQKGLAGRKDYSKRTWSNPHQGEKECARRRHQIERGILTASNGLA